MQQKTMKYRAVVVVFVVEKAGKFAGRRKFSLLSLYSKVRKYSEADTLIKYDTQNDKVIKR